MRRGLTLIELIFTMVIIALVFTVIPKIIFASNKAMQLQIKEDALFEAVSLMGQIARVAWDNRTITTHGKILKNSKILCQDGKPQNGWTGQRSCSEETPNDTERGGCDDLDDFDGDGCHENATGGRNGYALHVVVTTNLDENYKEANVTVEASEGNKSGALKSTFTYRSYNIGWAYVERKHVR